MGGVPTLWKGEERGGGGEREEEEEEGPDGSGEKAALPESICKRDF